MGCAHSNDLCASLYLNHLAIRSRKQVKSAALAKFHCCGNNENFILPNLVCDCRGNVEKLFFTPVSFAWIDFLHTPLDLSEFTFTDINIIYCCK